MKTTYMVGEFDPIVEQFRQLFAKQFGVTVQGHHLTLRREIDGVHTEISMLISEVRQSIPCCDNCGDVFDAGDHRYKVKEEIKHDGRKVNDRILEICGECAK